MLLAHDDDGLLAVERDQVQPVAVDRQPDQTHVEAAVAHAVLLRPLLDRHELETVAPPATPGAGPLVGGCAGDEADAEGTLDGGHRSRLVRGAKAAALGTALL
ncbi:hypothetical protein GCM10027026_10370 [Myroides odoratimimus subsp. xuanwuensis]